MDGQDDGQVPGNIDDVVCRTDDDYKINTTAIVHLNTFIKGKKG